MCSKFAEEVNAEEANKAEEAIKERSLSPVGLKFWSELRPCARAQTLGEKCEAPKPRGVSFGELVLVRKTPRTSQPSAQDSSAKSLGGCQARSGSKNHRQPGLESDCNFQRSGENEEFGIRCGKAQGGSVTADERHDTPFGMGLMRRVSQCHLAPSAPSQKESPRASS